jgi:hypothetical protein
MILTMGWDAPPGYTKLTIAREDENSSLKQNGDLALSSIMSILSSGYSSAAQSQSLIPLGAKFANVDPAQYQGKWTGKDVHSQPFTISVTDVKGYRANVVLQSANGMQSAKVFITTKGTFRVGDSSFTLTGPGKGKISTVVTDPTTGNQSIDSAPATLST